MLLRGRDRFCLPLNHQHNLVGGGRDSGSVRLPGGGWCFFLCAAPQLDCPRLSCIWLSNADFSDFSLFDSPIYKKKKMRLIVPPLLAAFACVGCCTSRRRSGKKWRIYRKALLHSPHPARHSEQEAPRSPEAERVEKLQRGPLAFEVVLWIRSFVMRKRCCCVM